MLRLLSPAPVITYPPSPFLLKRVFFCTFYPFLTLDKIKVGGDSCSPQHCCILKIKVSSPSYIFLLVEVSIRFLRSTRGFSNISNFPILDSFFKSLANSNQVCEVLGHTSNHFLPVERGESIHEHSSQFFLSQ